MSYAIIETVSDPADVRILTVIGTKEAANAEAERFIAAGRRVRVRPVLDAVPTEGIQTPTALASLAKRLGTRVDWHEPDEQGLNARIIGTHLDNAMGSTVHDEGKDHCEFNVVLTKAEDDGPPLDIAVINLANLLAWASAWGQHTLDAVTQSIAFESKD